MFRYLEELREAAAVSDEHRLLWADLKEGRARELTDRERGLVRSACKERAKDLLKTSLDEFMFGIDPCRLGGPMRDFLQMVVDLKERG